MGRGVAVFGALWRLGSAEAVAYRASTLVWILTTSFPLVSLALWSAIAREGAIGDYGQADFVSYFLAAFLIRQLTASWIVWDLDRQVRTGELNALLMRPVHPVAHLCVQNLATQPIRLMLAVPLALALSFALDGAGPGLEGGAWLWMLPAIGLAWLIIFTTQLVVGCLAFWFTHSESIYDVWTGLFIVLSGYAVPTSLFPDALATVARALPFHAALGFPVELWLGRLTRAEILEGFALQLGWAVVFSVAAWVAWRRGLRRYGAVGG